MLREANEYSKRLAGLRTIPQPRATSGARLHLCCMAHRQGMAVSTRWATHTLLYTLTEVVCSQEANGGARGCARVN